MQSSGSALLWLHARPGAGKSVPAAYVSLKNFDLQRDPVSISISDSTTISYDILNLYSDLSPFNSRKKVLLSVTSYIFYVSKGWRSRPEVQAISGRRYSKILFCKPKQTLSGFG